MRAFCVVCNHPKRAYLDQEVRNHQENSRDRLRLAPLDQVIEANAITQDELREHVTQHMRLPWPLGGGEAA